MSDNEEEMADALVRDPRGTCARVAEEGGHAIELFFYAVLSAPDNEALFAMPEIIDLAAKHRRSSEQARYFLQDLEPALAVAAIERAPLAPIVRKATMPERRDYLARYESGEYEVWDELVSRADAVLAYPDLAEETLAVAKALMRRVNDNAKAVRTVLEEAGAILDVEEFIDNIPPSLPISLRAFFEEVGTLVLTPIDYDYGECSLESEGISLLACDPLFILGEEAWLESQIEEYEEETAGSHRDIVGPMQLKLSADYLHKQNISGGAQYSVYLGGPEDADAIDPFVCHERHRLRLVGYLRHAFEWGGFPNLDVCVRDWDNISLNLQVPFKRVDRKEIRAVTERLVAKLRKSVVSF